MASGRKNVYYEDFSKSGPAECSTDVSKIVDEFHCLYNEKIMKLEMTNPGCAELKIGALEEWVRDLTEQNRMLVKTVENLEKNALDRVDTLDSVLRKKTAENESRPPCKNCPDLNVRCDNMKAELENAKKTIIEKECCIQNHLKQIEDMKKTLSKKSAVSNQATQKCMDSEYSQLEEAMLNLKTQLCKNEKLLNLRTEDLKCTKYKLEEMEQMNEMLQAEAEKSRCIPKLQEAIGLLRDAVNEKDCILEQYHQEIDCLKNEMTQMEEQDCKIYQLEDSIKYYEQVLKQKDLMLEKLKAHIKQLRQCLSQLQCQQDREDYRKINRSSSYEENYSVGEVSGYATLRNDDAIMAGGDSELVEELRKKLANEKDMQIALTAEVAEKHDSLMRMKDHMRDLEEQLRQSDMQTHFKDDIIRQLRKEVKLGRAKESLAEMLGLKGGPRAQMKAKIDHLHSELEEREIEISRLESKLEASRLPMLEAKLTKLEMELVDRERSVLALCDKLDYVRRYLNKLRASEEDISVKCGLEALLLELSEDVEWTRETRRNISTPSTEDPKESIIIINHRSHSLPDTTLQKQVQSFKEASERSAYNDAENQEEDGESLSLKEQISTLECNLSDTLSQLNSMWDTMKACELENGDSVFRLTKEVQSSLEKEHNQLLLVNDEMQYIACQVNEMTTLGVNNDYLLHCIEKCLIDSLNLLNKQKALLGITESSTGSLADNFNTHHNLKYINGIEAFLGDSVSLIQQLKTKIITWEESASKIDVNKTNEITFIVNNLISSRQNILDKLCLVNVSQEEIAKKIFKKFSEFDNTFGTHQNVVKGLKYVLNHFMFNDFISKNSNKDVLALEFCEDSKDTNKVPLKDLKVTSVDVCRSDLDLKQLRSLRKNRLSRSSPSIGEEYQSDVLGNIHMKIAHLQQIALTLNKEIKYYLKEVFLREDKTRQFVSESQDLNKTLNNLSKALCASEKTLIEYKVSISVPSLQNTLTQAQTEVELLLCKVDDFTNYNDMYDMNRSKLEQEIHELQKDMFTVVSDIMDAIKASQDYDNNLLNSYRTKIQSYREKVEQLEKHLTNSIDQNEIEEKDEEEDLVCKLTEKIEKYQIEVDKLKNSINIVKKDKETVEMENQKVMDELQAKICTLQAALQSESQQQHPEAQAVISKLGAIIKHQEEKIVRMYAYINQQKEEYLKMLNQESDQREVNKVFTLQSIKEQLEYSAGVNPSEEIKELRLIKMENIQIKKELEQALGLTFSQRTNIEELQDKLIEVQDEAYTLRARALKQKEQFTYLIEECKKFKSDKEKIENEKEDLIYEITNLREELTAVKESECKIAAEMVKNSQKNCQLAHEKENLEKALQDKIELNQKLEIIVSELTKECGKMKNESEVLQFMRNKIEALNQEISDKNAKVRGLEHRLKNLLNPYQMEGQELIQTNENDEEMEIVNKKSMTLEESIDNLEAENIKLCNENMRLKNEIKLFCKVNNDSALSNVPVEGDDDNCKMVLLNKVSTYRKKLKTFMQQNWRLIETVNKLQHINNLLASNKETIKLRRH
ncbi:uncharacterized protein isoform X3 [Rhodnius prolixus]|uniref:uncharacterized protein isoform X3 n=1 Tax=Rhodnius prolixus TaxID=13249 RepID=UPI003D188D09